MRYIDCCSDCGKKRYTIKRDAGAITMTMRKCPICKENKLIVPATDWAYMEMTVTEWD